MELSQEFIEGAFFAICQRAPTNREMANIARYAEDKRQAIHFIKNLPEADRFFNNFYGLSFNWINLNLAIGECPSSFQADLLIEDGINYFFNVTEQAPPYVDMLPDEVTYRSIILKNDEYNGPGPILEAARDVLIPLREGHRVYLHCFSGISRSAAVAAMVIGSRDQMTYQKAIDFVRSRRPVAHPHPDLLTPEEAEQAIKELSGEA